MFRTQSSPSTLSPVSLRQLILSSSCPLIYNRLAAKHTPNKSDHNASQTSRLKRTDTTTMYPGKDKTVPVTPRSLPRPKAGNQPTNVRPTTQDRPICQLPTAAQRPTPVQTPAVARSPHAAPSAPRAVGTILVPETQEDKHSVHNRTPARANTSARDLAIRRPNNRAGEFN